MPGHGRDQAAGVGMIGVAQDLGGGALFDQLAAIQHRHAIGHVGDHAHVVRDDDHADLLFAAQLAQQLQDLRLDGHVQRRGRFVGDDDFRLAAQRQRDHHALPHAAGELVRILLGAQFGLVDADLRQQLHGALGGLGLGQVQVHLHGFHQLAFHGLQRIQRGQRILEDHADAPAAHAALLRRRQRVDAFAVEQHLAAGQPAGRFQQADHGVADGGLAGAGFAHHAQDLAFLQAQGHAVHRHHGAAAAGKFDADVVDVQQGHDVLSAASD